MFRAFVCAVVKCLVACAGASAHWEMKHAVPVLQPFSCSRNSQVLFQTPPISDTCLGQLRTRLACSADAYVCFDARCTTQPFVQVLPSPDEPGISLSTRIERLKALKQHALAQKKETAKALKATQKKMRKVHKALSKLSDDDLSHAVQQRAAAKAAAKAAARAAPAPPHIAP